MPKVYFLCSFCSPSNTGRNDFPSIGLGVSKPAAAKKVGATSQYSTNASEEEPGSTLPGQRTIIPEASPNSKQVHLANGNEEPCSETAITNVFSDSPCLSNS